MIDKSIAEINPEEIRLAKYCINTAISKGASSARISLSKSTIDSISLINGEIDRVIHAADRSIFVHLFVDGKYGTYSTNKLEESSLEDFIEKAIENSRMLSQDPFRQLPAPERCASDAITGKETELYDEQYYDIDSDQRLKSVFGGSKFKEFTAHPACKIISEECEYSDSMDDNYIIDSNGVECRHIETSFSYSSEMTIEDTKGNKYSGFWWEISPFIKELDVTLCSTIALDNAINRIGVKKHKGGNLNMVVKNGIGSRLLSPILSSLNAEAIQQKRSFLIDSKDKQIFSKAFTLVDKARKKGSPGSRLFDTEGVATKNKEIITEGRINQYFTNTYMSKKVGYEPTIEGISNPHLMPYSKSGINLESEGKLLTLHDVLTEANEGIYVTAFNGGNCNSVTGDFSYGVEGFIIKDGKLGSPIKEMIITGNIIELWSNILSIAEDAREVSRWKIPTLAFSNVEFSS